ncbi:hypothetical protein [Xanthobacter sp.]|uniref:hypothetical protein n=1 Tax=Xanthobacter sp. TaxID=35809 RepID=UPI0025CE01D9|nr:hypothetical protein [Xanthobacter sp.]
MRAVLDEVDKATEGGNPFRVSELFGDMQVLDALRAVLPRRDLIEWKNTILNESAGTLAEDWNFLKTTPAERQAVLDAVTEEGNAKACQQFEPHDRGPEGHGGGLLESAAAPGDHGAAAERQAPSDSRPARRQARVVSI